MTTELVRAKRTDLEEEIRREAIGQARNEAALVMAIHVAGQSGNKTNALEFFDKWVQSQSRGDSVEGLADTGQRRRADSQQVGFDLGACRGRSQAR